MQLASEDKSEDLPHRDAGRSRFRSSGENALFSISPRKKTGKSGGRQRSDLSCSPGSESRLKAKPEGGEFNPEESKSSPIAKSPRLPSKKKRPSTGGADNEPKDLDLPPFVNSSKLPAIPQTPNTLPEFVVDESETTRSPEEKPPIKKGSRGSKLYAIFRSGESDDLPVKAKSLESITIQKEDSTNDSITTPSTSSPSILPVAFKKLPEPTGHNALKNAAKHMVFSSDSTEELDTIGIHSKMIALTEEKATSKPRFYKEGPATIIKPTMGTSSDDPVPLDFHVTAYLYGASLQGRLQFLSSKIVFESYKFAQDSFGNLLDAIDEQGIDLGFKPKPQEVRLPFLPIFSNIDMSSSSSSTSEDEDIDGTIFRRITTRQPTNCFEDRIGKQKNADRLPKAPCDASDSVSDLSHSRVIPSQQMYLF